MENIMATEKKRHVPVLLNEVVDAISPKDGEIYIDGTFGAGGYSRAILEKADCRVIAIDRDPEAVFEGQKTLCKEFYPRLDLISGRFSEMSEIVAGLGITNVHGIMLDIGVSSMQIDDASRGFSFSKDGPLDMRMEKTGKSAADIVNNLGEKELADIIYKYGEEKASRRVARAIVYSREKEPITTTTRLANIIRSSIGKHGKDKIDPATKTFQALRIYINKELEELEKGLDCAEKILSENGRLAIVTFHSLEDRIVKNFIKEKSGKSNFSSRHLPEINQKEPTLSMPSKNSLKPNEQETIANPRSRSARLRVAIRTKTPAIN